MEINSSNLIIGTANLCTKYGIKAPYINKSKSKNLLNYTHKKNIKILDISTNYDCYKILVKQYNFQKWKISFKISSKDINHIKSEKDAKIFINNLLKSLNKKKIEYFLFHNFKDIFSKGGECLFNELRRFKKKNKIGKIGISVYSGDEIKKVLKKYEINVVQAPFNILDQRLNDKKLIKMLNTKKIEIHVRSIFLQGVLIEEKLIPKKLTKFNEIYKWYNFLKKNNLNNISETFNFLQQHKFIKKMIIGVRSTSQLIEILQTKINKNKRNYSVFKTKTKSIVDPRQW